MKATLRRRGIQRRVKGGKHQRCHPRSKGIPHTVNVVCCGSHRVSSRSYFVKVSWGWSRCSGSPFHPAKGVSRHRGVLHACGARGTPRPPWAFLPSSLYPSSSSSVSAVTHPCHLGCPVRVWRIPRKNPEKKQFSYGWPSCRGPGGWGAFGARASTPLESPPVPSPAWFSGSAPA